MNRDEVMAMNDEELRIKAAELMGWRRHLYGNYQTQMQPPDKPTLGGIEQVRSCPDYPHDIAAAWELFEVMVASDKEPSISSCGITEIGIYDVWFEVNDARHVIDASADTAPLAITRAFVMAMASKESDEGELVTDTG